MDSVIWLTTRARMVLKYDPSIGWAGEKAF
jgi:hypothetical protein